MKVSDVGLANHNGLESSDRHRPCSDCGGQQCQHNAVRFCRKEPKINMARLILGDWKGVRIVFSATSAPQIATMETSMPRIRIHAPDTKKMKRYEQVSAFILCGGAS